MATLEDDTLDAFKGLLHPGMIRERCWVVPLLGGSNKVMYEHDEKFHTFLNAMIMYSCYEGDMNNSMMDSDTTMPPRRGMAQTLDVDLAAQQNELRQMMLAQQQEIAPVNQPVASKILNADPVIPENPMAPEVPIAPLAVPPTPLVRTPEELYDKFRRMKALEFEGSTNPIEADN
ncbi:hypothetical protein TIFTF001_041957 [Ficus carica]|uniref:Uncharacterized protein n=1 Tax=Ficus carica TaxID=3494 RepID=A0AA87ZV03_FICCA|nr:hypothetical protein TIFTF001_041955 [Ficus carica]GMN33823.1 hypothetical protein TIFTF001_041957 [Ficus carica]